MVNAIIVMGVSGCGKSSVARAVSEKLGYRFVEGDELHPEANVDKMTRGIPLNDEDRWPWLDKIGQVLHDAEINKNPVVLTCSALKRTYRERLRDATGGPVAFIYLKGSAELLNTRMGQREGHFMPLLLLKTQLETLEEPTGEPGVITVDIDETLDVICEKAVSGLDQIRQD